MVLQGGLVVVLQGEGVPSLDEEVIGDGRVTVVMADGGHVQAAQQQVLHNARVHEPLWLSRQHVHHVQHAGCMHAIPHMPHVSLGSCMRLPC